MQENINIKQIIITAGITLGFMAILVGAILALNAIKSSGNKTGTASTPDQNSGDDMASMHAPPPPADDTIFKSLLGKPAPDFTLEAYDGRRISLKDLKGKNVVIFFTEGAMCYPSCWDQMVAFSKEPKFNNDKTVVLSIVVDPRSDWAEAVKQMPQLSSSTVLLDIDRNISLTYGALTLTSSMHRGQFPGHTYIIVDKEGIVRYLLDDEYMQIRNKELLKELDKLS